MLTPIFAGNLVRLATPRQADQEIFASWTDDDEYMRLLDDDPVRPQSVATFGHFGDETKNDNFYFHLRTIEGDQLIGFVVLFNLKWRNQTAELAIGIGAKDFRGKGYGRDSLNLILNYAFSELCLRRVSLTVLDYNTRAIQAYERVGFQREGAHRQAVHRSDQYYDLLLYGILREEWLRLQRK
jgi:RimJ/RimL family protein N-acetyltransferase